MAAMAGGMPDEVYEGARAMVAAADPSDMSEPTLQMRGISMSHRDWQKANERRLSTRATWNTFFESYDVLLCPCAFVPAFPHDHSQDMHSRRLMVNGQERLYTAVLFWAGLTLNAYLPATVRTRRRHRGWTAGGSANCLTISGRQNDARAGANS